MLGRSSTRRLEVLTLPIWICCGRAVLTFLSSVSTPLDCFHPPTAFLNEYGVTIRPISWLRTTNSAFRTETLHRPQTWTCLHWIRPAASMVFASLFVC